MRPNLIILLGVLFLLSGCKGNNTAEIENLYRGKLISTKTLALDKTVKFELDDESAPISKYTQFITDNNGERQITFLNSHNNSIYIYNYDTGKFSKKISWSKRGPNGISGLSGYYIKSPDTIYLYNKHNVEIVLSNYNAEITKKISLRENNNNKQWGMQFPQYNLQTVNPIIETDSEIILNGFFFGAIPESIIDDFKFTSRINKESETVTFSNRYPKNIYGNNYNWDGEIFTTVFPELHPDGDKLILSYPTSHDIYISYLNEDRQEKIYAGSNNAKTIKSIDKAIRNTTDIDILSHVIDQDIYTGIRYDKYRKVYYRFLLNSDPSLIKSLKWKRKPLSVIIMDEEFNYLGETTLGTYDELNWQNSFVTKEGLNIEYLGSNINEDYLVFNIYKLGEL